MNNSTQKFELHYYLKNNSHSMNAFVRNKAEKNFLEVIKRIGELSDIELKIETEAYQEGGLMEIILINISSTLDFLSPTINNTITHYMTRDTEAEALNNENKKLTNEGLRLDNQIKRNDIKIQEFILKKLESDKPKETSKSEKEINRLDDKITKRYVSEFYKTIDSYEKVEKIGYSKFKQEVIEGKHKFSNGSMINCIIEIKITFDEFGDEKSRQYRVSKVFGAKDFELGGIQT